MRRLRLLRFLLLALLLPFVVVVVIMLRNPGLGRTDPPLGGKSGDTATDIEYEDFFNGIRRYLFIAGLATVDEKGDSHFEKLHQLEVYREGRSPLLFSADRGSMTGGEGQRLTRIEGNVSVEDPDEKLRLSLDALEINQAAGEARSLGAVEFSGPTYHGRADSVVYGLEGQPAVITAPVLESSDGSTLRAERARLLDGTRDVAFEDGFRISDPNRDFHADTLRVQRRQDGDPEHMVASGGVEGFDRREPDAPGAVFADRVEAYWGQDGEISSLSLDGDGVLRKGANELVAERIWAVRAEGASEWSFAAHGAVVAKAQRGAAPAVLRCAELAGRMAADGELIEGEASGGVHFETRDAVADAASAAFDPGDAGKEITLRSSTELRARVLQGRSRVTAETIRTNPDGTYLLAEGRVEASLLPASPEAGDAPESGLFDVSEAIHFVSARLEGNPRTNVLEFVGSVRGWQGERNLKADRVRLDRAADSLTAVGQVSTRLPRIPERGTSEADYIQVSAEQLDYSGKDRLATYSGTVRVRQAEGFMDSQELVVTLSPQGKGVSEVLARGGVAFEFRAADANGLPRPVTGTADRAVYDPQERVMNLYGDRAPAAVRREGEGGAVTKGRVLRYHLGTGALEVQSGERDRAKIQTSGNPGN